MNQLVPGNKKKNQNENDNADQTNESENTDDESTEKKKKSRRNQFNLYHYHDTFRKTVDDVMNAKESKLDPTTKKLREWFQSDYRLVILTTAQVLPNAPKTPSSVDFPFEDVFLTGQGEAFSFGQSEPEVWHMLRDRPAEEVSAFHERFLRRLRIVSGQAQVEALKAPLRQALVDALGEPPTPRADVLAASYSDYLHGWWKDDSWNFTEATHEILAIVRTDLHKRLTPLGFTGAFYVALEDRLSKDSRGYEAAYIIVKDMPAERRCSALASVLANRNDRCVILTESTFKDYPAGALEDVCTNPDLCSVLLLSIDSMDDGMRRFVDKILNGKTCKVIVVTSEWKADIYNFLSNRVRYCGTWSEHWALKHLHEDFRKIALEKRVIFQSYEQPLAMLKSTWPTRDLGIRGVALNALLTGASLRLDFPVPPRHSVYLPQEMEYQGPSRTELAPTIWTCRTTTERFVLRGFPQRILDRLESNASWKKYDPVLEFIGHETSANTDRRIKFTEWAEWGKEPRKWRNKNLHQLSWEGGAIIHNCLIYVSEYKKILERYVKEGTLKDGVHLVNERYNVEELISKHGVNCLTSEPGMGKSSFLAHMADILKQEYPLELVIFLRISHESLIRDTPEDVLLKDIIDLFTRVVNWESAASREAMRHLIGSCLHRSGQVSILIDGFDEVCPAHKGKALRVLRVLTRDAKFRRLWVTTRPVVEEELTGALGCAPFRLRPFSEDDQREYLLRRWGDEQTAGGERLAQRVDRFLTAVRVATAHDGRSMCEVPLYMRMLADTFRSHTTDHTRSEPNLSRLKIIQKFVEESRKLFWQRGDVTIDVAENRGLFVPSEHMFLHQHKICGAYLIFRNHDLGDNFKKTIEREVTTFIDQMETEKTGIIVKVSDGSPVFIHRIFEEYFAGLWLKEHYEQVPSLMEGLLRGELEEVRYFLDGLLAEGRALHEAALGGQGDALAAALRAGAAVDEADAGGRTALHLAAAHAHRDAARALLHARASVHARDRVRGWTALQYADALLRLPKRRYDKHARRDACSPHLGVAEELLRHKADPRHAHRTLKSDATLFFALANDYPNVAEAFFKSCALRHVRKVLPTDYMQVAAEHDSAEAVSTLIRLGFDLNSSFRDDERRVALHIAAENGNKSVCEDLLQHGARVDKRDKHGNRPLHNASLEGHDSVCKLLLEHKAKPNSKNKEGKTPLILAASQGHEAVCRTLLDRKARVDIKDANGKTAKKYAEENGHHEVYVLCARLQGEYVYRQEGNQDCPLHWATRQGDEEMCRTLLDRGEPVNAKDASGNTALHLCAAQGHVALCELLLERGATVDERDAHGNSALHLAAENGHAAVCEVLVARNADILARNQWNLSVYNLALEHDDVIHVLDNCALYKVDLHHGDESTQL